MAFFTGFYGNPDVSLRHSLWALLRRLTDMAKFDEFPWIIGGDFNDIMHDSEKIGGNRLSSSQLEAFRNVLNEFNLQSHLCERDHFTWVNRHQNNGLIFERLDRFVSLFAWRMMYPMARCSALDYYHSDHCPIHINLSPGIQRDQNYSDSRQCA